MASIDTIKNTLQAMKFAPVEGKNSEWAKIYPAFNHTINVTLAKAAADCRIDYGTAIKDNAGRSTTQNLSQSESLVVLECIDRLLDLDYPPASLVLEKQFPLGHTGGYLDVLVLQDGKAYLMVECKTWGAEFDKERGKLFDDGGQMLTYFHQDRAAKFIGLYASRLSGGAIERNVCAVDTSILHGDSVAELFESWDKSFFEVGAFEGTPYQIQERRLTKADLADMKQEDGGRIFNAFAEILRRHVISDKPNAFNKIFNLFICKVQDEEKQDDEALDFQWQAGETAESVLSRLNDLYKAGMSQYLHMNIADHTEAEIDKLLGGSGAESDRQALHNIFTELRLYKNNEFAFKEVFDKKTFHANAEVVREIVRLLQGKKLRYASKQQFLGDFFELLLNTSVKQEAGQFFTPIPIARFVIDSLPLRAIINAKLKANDANFLPYLIDFASGSGHFMTEGMDRIDRMVKDIDGSKARTAAKGNLRKWREDYAWANEFIYGIEKDYRLAKTAKVSCFLNGDGEANMVLGDGLDNFALSQEYTGKLLNTALPEGERDNPQFDVLAANPPYSVGACKKTIRHGEKSFTLWPRLTDASSEIECLFVERAKQLLKPGGVTGILLPSSMLSNGGIYEATRDILLRFFRVKAIAVMGSGTFMATGTNTVILFMERRENNDHTRIASLIAKFFEQWQDMTIAGQENAFALYAGYVWSLDLADYVALLRSDSKAPDHALLRSYQQAFDGLTEIRTLKEKRQFRELPIAEQVAQLETRFRIWLREREQEKLLVFFLANGQNVVLAKAPSDKNAEKVFLGYEFSNRKGSEGLKILSGTHTIETALYSETNESDPNKINTLIRQNFLDEKVNVPQALADYVVVAPLLDLMTFDQVRFDKTIGTSIKKKVHSERWSMVRLGDVVTYSQRGKSPKYGSGPVQVIKSGQARGWYEFDFTKPQFLDPAFQVDAARILRPGDLLINSTGVGTAGRVTLFRHEGKFSVDSHITIVRVDSARITPDFMLAAMAALGFSTIEGLANGQSGQIELSLEIIRNIPVPLPPLVQQRSITRQLSRYDLVESTRIAHMQDACNAIRQKVNRLYTPNTRKVKIGDLFGINQASLEPKKVYGDDLFTYVDISAVDGEGGTIAFSKKIPGNKAPSRARRLAAKGDLLVSTVRPNLKAFSFLREQPANCVYSTGFAIISSKSSSVEMNQMLFLLFMYSDDLMAQIEAKMPKQAYPSITQTDIAQFTVPDQIANPQTFIAEIAELEQIISRHKEKIEHLKKAKADYLAKWLH